MFPYHAHTHVSILLGIPWYSPIHSPHIFTLQIISTGPHIMVQGQGRKSVASVESCIGKKCTSLRKEETITDEVFYRSHVQQAST